MALFQSSNPVFKSDNFSKTLDHYSLEQPMTLQGTINKSILLGLLVVATSAISFLNPSPIFMLVGAIGGLICVLIATFRPTTAPYTAPLYAILEGLALGAISAMYAARFQGIVLNAVLGTFGVFFAMLFVYKSGLVKVTDKFRAGVIMATFAIFFVYMISMVLSFFGVHIPMMHEGGTFGIIFSLAVIAVATMNLLLDFDNIERGVQNNSPSYMEWMSALGLLVTLVWLYLEILRLLSRLRDR